MYVNLAGLFGRSHEMRKSMHVSELPTEWVVFCQDPFKWRYIWKKSQFLMHIFKGCP